MMRTSIIKPLIVGFIAIAVLIGYQTYLNTKKVEALSGANRTERQLATELKQIASIDSKTSVSLPSRASKAGIPAKITIPGIGVDAKIVEVGLKEDEMDAPKDPEKAGWYRYGPRPGDPGLSIIVGHSGWVNRRPVIFDSLRDVAIGDRLTITDDRGMMHEFIVRTIDRYPSHATLLEIQPQNISSDLVLITCAGDWDAERREYEERLVVSAKYIAATPLPD